MAKYAQWIGIVALVAAVWGLAQTVAAGPIISEVAWAGTAAGAADEWIELHNPTSEEIDLAGWTLRFGDVVIRLDVVEDNTREVRSRRIAPGDYFLLERTDDSTVGDVAADIIYSGSLANSGTVIRLLDPDGNEVDTANQGVSDGWAAGTGSDGEIPWATMERLDPAAPDTPANWVSNDGMLRSGTDAQGVPLNGTPRAENAAQIVRRTVPVVELSWPNEDGLVLTGTVVIEWTCRDPDGEDAGVRIDLWIGDADDQWIAIAEGLANGGAYTWDTTAFTDEEGFRIRLCVVDGDGLTSEAVGAPFAIANGH